MLAPKTRLLWLGVVFAVESLYLPLNRILAGGTELTIPWDAQVPIVPIWAVPYTFSVIWWGASFIWAYLEMDDERYRAFSAAVVITALAAYAVYILWPTYITRPEPAGSSWDVALLRGIYAHDEQYNAFPSGHVYNTLLIVFFWWNWRPRLRWLWAIAAVVVPLSTLFTGQHHLLDPLGGLIWAGLGTQLGWWVARRRRI